MQQRTAARRSRLEAAQAAPCWAQAGRTWLLLGLLPRGRAGWIHVVSGRA